ncbi:MAG: class I SAM-dependent methyltransferase [Solirubrobacteraceae bacterium]
MGLHPTAAGRIAALAYDYAAQPKEQAGMCNLCGARGECVIQVAERDRYGYPAILVACARCGLGWLSPRMTADAYVAFYAGVYRPLVSAFHGRRIDAETVQAQQRDYAVELADFLLPRLPRGGGTILDVGGSTGAVAGALVARIGGRATVLDPAPEELAVARTAGMETIAGLAEELDPRGRTWDLVLLCQTIDHLLDVRATLAALHRVTAAGGRAFIDILDVDLMLAIEGDIERVVKVDHPYYLARPTATAMFALTGYTILAERVSGDGHRGFLLAPGPPIEPDWRVLKQSAGAFLGRVGRSAPTVVGRFAIGQPLAGCVASSSSDP